MKSKKGISLIVLVITIIVMIILAGAIILSLSNAGIIGKANEAVKKTDKKQVETIAQTAWGEAYIYYKQKGEEITKEKLEVKVHEILSKNSIDITKYDVKVTEKGVSVEEIDTRSPNKYNWTYYTSIGLAVNDVNDVGKTMSDEESGNETVHKLGDYADASKDTAVAGVYINSDGTNVVLLKDTIEEKALAPEKDMIINLAGHKLTFAEGTAVGINGAGTNTNITVEGSTPGSIIEVNGSNKTSAIIQTRTNNFILNGGQYIAKTAASTTSETYNVILLNVLPSGTVSVNGVDMDAQISISSTEELQCNIVGVYGMGDIEVKKCDIDLSYNYSGDNENISAVIYGCITRKKGDISDTKILLNSNMTRNIRAYGVSNEGSNEGNVVLSSCNIVANSNYSSDENGYVALSIGVNNMRTATVNNCYVSGTHSGIQTNSTVYIDGGTYESFGHGGIYFTGAGTESWVKNAKIQDCEMPEGYPVSTVRNGGGFYVGGGTGNDGIKVYMDNCDLYGASYPLVLRGSADEKNNTVYISNSRIINKNTRIRVDKDTHKLYIGKGCNFDVSNVFVPPTFTQFDITTVVFSTDEVYAK